jgi:hypothetical protein
MDLTTVILFIVGIWFLSQIVLGIMDGIQIAKLSERVQFLKKLDDSIHQVRIEEHSGIEYWYDEHKNLFLGQGRSVEEIATVLKARFPDHIFLLKDRGGIAEQTGWKLMSPEEFRQLNIEKK